MGGTGQNNLPGTGVGDPVCDRVRSCEPMEQGHSWLFRSYAGNGLGLSLARRLEAILGGDLTVSSVVGKGSTFLLVLPLATRA